MQKSFMQTIRGKVMDKVLENPRLLAAMKAIDKEDFQLIILKVKAQLEKEGATVTQDYLERGILALQQFYALHAFYPKQNHAVSDLVDPFWHFHMLFSRQYQAFCEEAYGEFHHHQPLDPTSPADIAEVADCYNISRSILGECFVDVDVQFFPEKMPDARLVCRCDVERVEEPEVGVYA